MMRSARLAKMKSDEATELRLLQETLETCPGEISPIYELVRHYRRSKRQGEGHQKFVALLTERLKNPQYTLPPGVLEFLIRDPEAEEAELLAILDNVSRQVAGAETPNARLLRILVTLQQRVGRIEAAVVTMERLWEQTKADDLLWPLIGLYRRLERWQDAADLLAPKVEADPGGYLHLTYVGLLGKLGRYDDVLQQAEILAASSRADSADVEASDLHALLERVAWDLRDLGQDARAEQLFRRLLAETPNDAGLQAVLLNLYASEAEQQRHAEVLETSWETETDPNALLEEGTQRLTSGDAAGAIDLLRRAAAEFPDLEAVWYNLGLAAYKLEDWPTVDTALARSSELNPQRAQSLFYRGIALAKLERCGEAIEALNRSLEIDASQAIAHYYVYACHAKLGNEAEAAEARSRYEAMKNR